jgi:dipeptide/tripeptide permease
MTTRKEWQYAPLSEPAPDQAPISPTTTTAADTSHLFDSEDEEGDDEDVLFLNHPKDDGTPTLHELVTLRRIPAHIPPSAFLIALVELCERFAFYGLSGPFQNYISNAPGSANPGALGFGQAWATGLTSAFNMWCYLTSIAGAVVADQYVGKYSAIVIFSLFYLVGLVVLVVTALPASIAAGWAGWGLLLAMAIIGLGTGGIKANVAPLIAEQITEEKIHTKILKGGEKVLIDPDLTVQRIYMIFYLCINVGCLSGIITTYMEHHSGFWTAYLLAACFFVLGVVVLILGRKHYIVKPPRGSVIMDAIKVILLRFKSKDGFELAKPSNRRSLQLSPVTWDDFFVNEVQKTLKACRVLLFFPIYWAAYFQMMNNFVSQAGTMELHGIPVSSSLHNFDVSNKRSERRDDKYRPRNDNHLHPPLRPHNLPLSPKTPCCSLPNYPYNTRLRLRCSSNVLRRFHPASHILRTPLLHITPILSRSFPSRRNNHP